MSGDRRRRSRNPIHRLRRRLSDIERNSATRPGGPWRRATEYALFFTLPVAILLTFAFDGLEITVDRDEAARFRVGQDASGGDWSVVRVNPEDDRRPWAMTLPIGTVVVETRVVRRGWPIPSVVERPPPRLSMTLIRAPDEPFLLRSPDRVASMERKAGVSLTGADEAVLATLGGSTEFRGLAEMIRTDRPETVRSWGASIAACAATWLLLFITSIIGIRTTQFATWGLARLRRRRVVRRLRAGRCPDCLYDLHTERFPKRCPECGRVIWS